MRVREQENEREQKRKCKRDSVKVPAHLPVFHPFTVSCRCRTAFYLTLFLHPVACTRHLKMSNVLIVSFFSHLIYQAWVFHDFVALKSVTIDHSDWLWASEPVHEIEVDHEDTKANDIIQYIQLSKRFLMRLVPACLRVWWTFFWSFDCMEPWLWTQR